MKRILITGAGGSAAANFIDALRLSDEDYYFVGTDIKPYHLAFTPLDARFIVPPCHDPRYLKTINQIIKQEKIDFVHAQPDPEVLFLSQHRAKVDARLFLPRHQTIVACSDKARFNNILQQANVPVPLAFHLTDRATLKAALQKLRSKNDTAWLRAIRGAGSKASLPVSYYRHAIAWIDYWHTHKGLDFSDFMISEFLPGREFAFQSVWNQGRLVVSQARERVEYIFGNLTPSGQTSSPSVARTVNRDDVNRIATEAITAIDAHPTGVFCVDMKEDGHGVPRVTEINCGRFFTTSNFFAHAGVNMPDIYVRLAFDESIPSIAPYNPLPEDLWWIRMIDKPFGLHKGNIWNIHNLSEE